MDRDIEVIRVWKKLVRRSGSKMPWKNDLHFIYNSWCPEETKDANHLKEKRPMLKEILKQSLDATLQTEGLPANIVRKKEFRILWREVHGDVDPVGEKDLMKWTKKHIHKAKESKWKDVEPTTKRWLVTCYSRFRNLENSMAEISQEMKNWIEQYEAELEELEEFLEANPKYAKKRHRKKIEIGRQRMDDASKIYAKIPESVEEKEQMLAAEVFDVLYEHKKLKTVPAWARKIDKITMDQNIGIMRKGIDLGVDDMIAKNDMILEKLREIFDGKFKDMEKEISSLANSLQL